ncbi:MAG: class I tRNA ligase family protein, partial [Cyclobacteriaceae bacterium]
VFNGFDDPHFDKETGKIIKGSNPELDYFYPSDTLVTAPEILFFWVARMIIAGYEYTGEKPFKNVYLTGIVRDKQRRKMSKSLGNSPDPLDLIKEYGADGVRTGMLFSSPAGNDLLFDLKLCDQGKKFSIKIWNAFRLVQSLNTVEGSNPDNELTIEWFNNRFNQVLAEVEDHFSKFRISDALMSIYKLVWGDLCSTYLEAIKPAYQQPIDQATHDKTLVIFERVMKLIHPFMPFISEELWHEIKERSTDQSLIVSSWPKGGEYDPQLINKFTSATELITAIRNARNAKGISPKETVDLLIKCDDKSNYDKYKGLIIKMANLSSLAYTEESVPKSISFMSGTDKCFIPIGDTIEIDVAEERENLEKELEYNKGFLRAVMKKLENERFVQNAPAKVIETERQKQADAEAKIEAIESSLKNLG